MAPRRSWTRGLFGSSGFVLSVTLALGGCGGGESGDASNSGGNSAVGGGSSGGGGRSPAGGQPGIAGQNTAGGQAASGGQSMTGGQSATGGQSTTGGQVAGGGQSTAGGQSPTGGQSTAGGQNAGAQGGAMGPMGGSSPGGGGAGGDRPSGGSGGAGASGGTPAGAGGAPSGECTRALLDGLLDDYFEALSAGDASSLPLAPNVKFTENAQVTQVGTTDFWKNAGDTKYSQRALDTEACSAAAQAVIPENGMDLPVGLRIKVVGAQLTEIETIVVRPGDYTASFRVDSNPGAIIAIADEIGWHDEVPAAQRATRQQLAGWIDKYFRAFPSGVCNVSMNCRRLENGGGLVNGRNSDNGFSCSTGASCSANTPTTGGVFEPRVIIVDEVRGIAAGFTIFDFMTDGHLDMHMIKMSGGQVHAVHAILRDTMGESGWD